MDGDKSAIVFFVLCLTIVIGSAVWAGITFGKILERRAYTAAFEDATVKTYHDGYQDGVLAAQKEHYETK